MRNVLITAYAVHPFKGSEDAMGWNMLLQAAGGHEVIAVTRKNNREGIERYIHEHPEQAALFSRLSFLYFDWPRWLRTWKKGPFLSMIYYYGWQLTLAIWLRFKRLPVDMVHNLNFHNDWTPSFLWILGKPMVWGHVGHHSPIPRQYLLPVYGWKAYASDRLLWLLKNLFWHLDPFLLLCKRKASLIICMNTEAVAKLRLKNRYIVHPSVASGPVRPGPEDPDTGNGSVFRVLSVGRFVPLKAFDLTIRGFAQFYQSLPEQDRASARLTLVGDGPCASLLRDMVQKEGLSAAVDFIAWIPRERMDAVYDRSSVFLFPSHEGAGMVVPEAMSHGLPVVCLANEGPGAFIHPRSTLGISTGNYDETVHRISVKLTMLFYNPSFLSKESALSLTRHHERFRWEVRGEMLQNVYSYVQDHRHTLA